MSLLPAFNARKRNDDSASLTDAETDSRAGDSSDAGSNDKVFDLVPPESSGVVAPEPRPQGRNVHPVDMTDLSRLSIDRDGRLYWDGKPVEVRRRIAMSRLQIVGASIVAAFVVIGALGAAIQGAVAARELACRFGWSASSCALPGARPRPDIPA